VRSLRPTVAERGGGGGYVAGGVDACKSSGGAVGTGVCVCGVCGGTPECCCCLRPQAAQHAGRSEARGCVWVVLCVLCVCVVSLCVFVCVCVLCMRTYAIYKNM
jgi:hypothetical protein